MSLSEIWIALRSLAPDEDGSTELVVVNLIKVEKPLRHNSPIILQKPELTIELSLLEDALNPVLAFDTTRPQMKTEKALAMAYTFNSPDFLSKNMP